MFFLEIKNKKIHYSTLEVAYLLNKNKLGVVDGKNKSIKKAFKEGFEGDFYAFKDEMKKYQIPIFNIDTVTDLDLQLTEVFGKMNAKKYLGKNQVQNII